MKQSTKSWFQIATPTATCAALAAVALLSACSSAPTRFYTLATPLPVAASTPAQAQPAALLIDVMPVAVPESLARPQMVVGKSAGARADVLEDDRWTSPFNNELRDALVSGLTSRLGAIDVSKGGRSAAQTSYRIAISLRQLNAVKGEPVQASYSWVVTRSTDGRASVCQLAVGAPVQGSDLNGLVSGVQATVAAAADGIAASVRSLRDAPSLLPAPATTAVTTTASTATTSTSSSTTVKSKRSTESVTSAVSAAPVKTAPAADVMPGCTG